MTNNVENFNRFKNFSNFMVTIAILNLLIWSFSTYQTKYALNGIINKIIMSGFSTVSLLISIVLFAISFVIIYFKPNIKYISILIYACILNALPSILVYAVK